MEEAADRVRDPANRLCAQLAHLNRLLKASSSTQEHHHLQEALNSSSLIQLYLKDVADY